MSKRDKQPPIPDNLNELLTDEQVISLAHLERYGWYIYFVRRPLFQEVTIVLKNHDRNGYRWLRPDGDYSEPFFDLRPDDYE